MNELHTPPGYVEYPRDPKFRPMGVPQHLLMMAEGFTLIDNSWCVLGLIYLTGMHTSQVSLVHLVLCTVAGLLSAFMIRRRLSKIFRAMGWASASATAIALVPVLLSVLYAGVPTLSRVFGALALAVIVGTFLFARVVVYREFRKYDSKLPFFFGARRLGRIIGAMPAYARDNAG